MYRVQRCSHQSSHTLLPVGKYFSAITLDASDGDTEDVLQRHLAKQDGSKEEQSNSVRTTRREALHLYRDILRASRLFVWADERGATWRDVIRESARKEYEAARFEKDPKIVTRLLISGRDSLHQALQKLAVLTAAKLPKVHDKCLQFMAKREEIIKEEPPA